MESGELCVMIRLATLMPESLATVLVLGEVHAFLNTTACLLSVRICNVLFVHNMKSHITYRRKL